MIHTYIVNSPKIINLILWYVYVCVPESLEWYICVLQKRYFEKERKLYCISKTIVLTIMISLMQYKFSVYTSWFIVITKHLDNVCVCVCVLYWPWVIENHVRITIHKRQTTDIFNSIDANRNGKDAGGYSVLVGKAKDRENSFHFDLIFILSNERMLSSLNIYDALLLTLSRSFWINKIELLFPFSLSFIYFLLRFIHSFIFLLLRLLQMIDLLCD